MDNFWKNRFIKKIFIFFSNISLFLFFLISLKNSLNFSLDFQRPGALSLLLGLEPYSEFLKGNNIIFSNYAYPLYLQILYFLFIPFAIMPAPLAILVWALCNIAMILSSTFLLKKLFAINSSSRICLLLLILLGAFPARNVIGNGQLSIFIMHFMLLGIYLKKIATNGKSKLISYFSYGLSYIKYSFAPSLATFSVIFHGKKGFFLTCFPSLLGVTAMSLLFRTYSSIIGPLQVASKSTGNNYKAFGDLLSILNIFNIENNLFLDLISKTICIFLASFFVWICRNFDFKRFLTLTALSSLMFVTHLPYDYIFYYIPLAFAFSEDSSRIEKFSIIACWIFIGYGYWLTYKFNYSFSTITETSFYFLLNLGLYSVIYSKGRKKLKESSYMY